MPTLTLALHLVLAQSAAALPGPQPDSALNARIDSVARAFLFEWREAWQLTQRAEPFDATGRTRMQRLGDDLRNVSLRIQALHCHYAETPLQIRRYLIEGKQTAHASCPTWFPSGVRKVADERRSLDYGIQARDRIGIRLKRAAVTALLDSVAQHYPGNLRLAQQRVRFALDGTAFRDAALAAQECTEDAAQCLLLQGLVHHRNGRPESADSIFLRAATLMPEAERCQWNDVGMLLEPRTRAQYANMPCADRAAFETRLWWLADPLWLELGNERRAEHFARKVHVSLLTPLGNDGRQRFEPEHGGEAVVETLVRYGWPTQMYWAGWEVDVAHGTWLLRHAADTAAPYVVREYTRDRLRTIPDTFAIASPFRARAGHWDLNGDSTDHGWWPVEHYARDRSRIVELPPGQYVMLRRRGSARFAWAAPADSVLLGRRPGTALDLTLFHSPAADRVAAVRTFRARVGGRLLIDSPLPAGPALIGIELPGDAQRPAARLRFGETVPPSLTELGTAREVSQPLLFEPTDEVTAGLGADSAIARMYGSTTFPRLTRLGVYWEGYGFARSDTVDVELRVVREDRPGVLSRAAAMIGLAGEGKVDVALRWRDVPGSARAIQLNEGGVPVQMRDVALDVSRLSRGMYRLFVTMTVPGGSPVRAERAFELR